MPRKARIPSKEQALNTGVSKRGPVPVDEIDRVLPVRDPLETEAERDPYGAWWADGNLFGVTLEAAVRAFHWAMRVLHMS